MTRTVDLGPCCNCGNISKNVVMLARRGPVPGRGWGCAVCGLPPDGAVAVLCDYCCEQFLDHDEPLKMVCYGYASEGIRVPFGALPPGEFEHDNEKHEDEG